MRGGIASPAKKCRLPPEGFLSKFQFGRTRGKRTIKHRIARVLYVTTKPLGTIYSIYLYLKFKIFKK